jgi:hypothetical protein
VDCSEERDIDSSKVEEVDATNARGVDRMSACLDGSGHMHTVDQSVRTDGDTEVCDGDAVQPGEVTPVVAESRDITPTPVLTHLREITSVKQRTVTPVIGESGDIPPVLTHLREITPLTGASRQDESVPVADDQTPLSDAVTGAVTADWVKQPPVQRLRVRFTSTAERQLCAFGGATSAIAVDADHRLEYLTDVDQARAAITDILREDPRSTYRRKHCRDSLYHFSVDMLHVTCWFDSFDSDMEGGVVDSFNSDGGIVEVVRIRPIAQVEHCRTGSDGGKKLH